MCLCIFMVETLWMTPAGYKTLLNGINIVWTCGSKDVRVRANKSWMADRAPSASINKIDLFV